VQVASVEKEMIAEADVEKEETAGAVVVAVTVEAAVVAIVVVTAEAVEAAEEEGNSRNIEYRISNFEKILNKE
jgi:hypothetical protein